MVEVLACSALVVALGHMLLHHRHTADRAGTHRVAKTWRVVGLLLLDDAERGLVMPGEGLLHEALGLSHREVEELFDCILSIIVLLLQQLPLLFLILGVPQADLAKSEPFLDLWAEIVLDTQQFSDLLNLAAALHQSGDFSRNESYQGAYTHEASAR